MTLTLIVVPVLLVALVVIITAGIKIDSTKGGEQMIKNVFMYLVLFATLMMTIGGSVGAFMAIADIIAPAPYHQTFEDFRHWGIEKPIPENEAREEAMPSEEVLKQRYESMVQAEKNRQIERAKNSLIKSFGWIIIPFPIFIYFQRRLGNNEA